jgi:hypothetical protein
MSLFTSSEKILEKSLLAGRNPNLKEAIIKNIEHVEKTYNIDKAIEQEIKQAEELGRASLSGVRSLSEDVKNKMSALYQYLKDRNIVLTNPYVLYPIWIAGNTALVATIALLLTTNKTPEK